MTSRWPPCKQTKSRPSGANSMAVGLIPTLAPYCVSVKPAGRDAARSDNPPRNRALATTQTAPNFIVEYLGPGIESIGKIGSFLQRCPAASADSLLVRKVKRVKLLKR